jgi:DNA-binding NtrC family response regulator
MNRNLLALLAHDRPELFQSLERSLQGLAIETCSVATCKQAEKLIGQYKPHIIFAESSLADGPWTLISDMAEAADVPLSVIVVANHPDTRLYLSVMERGAFDFIAPPFEREPLNFVVRSAVLNTQRRRQPLTRAAVA